MWENIFLKINNLDISIWPKNVDHKAYFWWKWGGHCFGIYVYKTSACSISFGVGKDGGTVVNWLESGLMMTLGFWQSGQRAFLWLLSISPQRYTFLKHIYIYYRFVRWVSWDAGGQNVSQVIKFQMKKFKLITEPNSNLLLSQSDFVPWDLCRERH